MERGLILAFSAVILWGLLDAASRYSVVVVGADPWIFSCVNLITGALIMLAVAGKGHGKIHTLYHAHTWVFGFFRVLMTLFLVFAFTSISASEANFMLRINVIMGMAAGYFIFKRKPQRSDIPGLALLIGGYTMLVLRQDDGFLNIAVLLVIAAAVCDTLLTVIAESHPVSNRASGISARLRYTGFVLLVTSLFFVAMALLLAYLKSLPILQGLEGSVGMVVSKAPSLESFIHPGTWIAGGIIGVLLRAPSMYLYLYAARLLKTENLMMAATLAPFATLGAEGLFVAMGLMDTPTLDTLDVVSGFAMTTGALLMVFLRANVARRNTTQRIEH